MITTDQLIATTLAYYAQAGKDKTPGEEQTTHKAIDKAVAIVTAKTLVPNADGTWTVRDSAGSGKQWTVNGRCTCPAALKDQRVSGVEKGVCKHRIAVKFARRLQAHFQGIIALQHTHHCQTCRTPTTCWAEPCKEVVDVVTCPACEAALALSPLGQAIDHAQHSYDDAGGCYPDCLACAQAWQDDHTTLQDYGTSAEVPQTEAEYQEEKATMDTNRVTLTADELTALAAPVYEENPQTQPCPVCFLALDAIDHGACRTFEASVGHDVPPATVAMPEAPASMNLKIKLPGGHELMVTMRSMQTGHAGDEELVNRLPWMLEKLEALSEPSAPEKPSWLYRLMSSFRPRTVETEGK